MIAARGLTWVWLYRHWGKVSLFTALYAATPLAFIHSTMTLAFCLLWLQVPTYMLHQFEEHAENGFQRFVNLETFKSGREDFPMDARFIFWVRGVSIQIRWM